MLQKILILTLFLYFLTLLQTSFFVYFTIFGFVPNFVLISVAIIIFLIPNNYLGYISAVTGGFFLDVFSGQPIGWNVAILLGLAIFINLVIKKYFY